MEKMDISSSPAEIGVREVEQTDLDAKYIAAAISDNTRTAYQSDVAHFLAAGYELPASPEKLQHYLMGCAEQYNPRTLARRLIGIGQWHQTQGMIDPTKAAVVAKTMSGIARLHGLPKKQAPAINMSDLGVVIKCLDKDPDIRATRDKAIILTGFFGAFRRSELSALSWEQVEFVSDGVILKIPRSKTDQTGEGGDCVIPIGREPKCPVRALIDWQAASKQYSGPVFRKISGKGTIGISSLRPESINRLIRKRAKEARLINWQKMSSHSLRRGFATEAARKGASMPAIQRHGRWRSVKTVVEYIEAGRQFADSAVNVLIEE